MPGVILLINFSKMVKGFFEGLRLFEMQKCSKADYCLMKKLKGLNYYRVIHDILEEEK